MLAQISSANRSRGESAQQFHRQRKDGGLDDMARAPPCAASRGVNVRRLARCFWMIRLLVIHCRNSKLRTLTYYYRKEADAKGEQVACGASLWRFAQRAFPTRFEWSASFSGSLNKLIVNSILLILCVGLLDSYYCRRKEADAQRGKWEETWQDCASGSFFFSGKKKFVNRPSCSFLGSISFVSVHVVGGPKSNVVDFI